MHALMLVAQSLPVYPTAQEHLLESTSAAFTMCSVVVSAYEQLCRGRHLFTTMCTST